MDSLGRKAKVWNIDAVSLQKVWDIYAPLHKLQTEKATKQKA